MTDEASMLEDTEVVLVSYRSASHVRVLLETWPPDLRVVVVDNSDDDGVQELLSTHENLRYLDGGNQGFARAANMGALSSEKQFLVFVNPDSRPTAADLEALVGGLADDPRAATHAATMVGAEGDIEIGVGGWEPSVLRTFVFAFGLHKRWPAAGLYAKPDQDQAVDVDWTTGACMAVRRTTFTEVGGFDEAFFVYSEDTAFGRQARDAGWHSVLRPDVLVAHGAGSSGAPSLEMYRLRGASFAGYVSRYHSRGGAGTMRGLLVLGSLLRAMQRRLRGNPSEAGAFLALARGAATGRAYVQGREVAEARRHEVGEQGGQAVR